jgi:hypothetical protein
MEFVVTIKEFTTEADPVTQTYLASFIMPFPKEVTILPGMTATILEYQKTITPKDAAGFNVPLNAVVIDEKDNYYVWKLKASEDGKSYTVHKTIVKAGKMILDSIRIPEGLNKGERIAAAGVNFLQEGQKVRLLDTQSGSKQK